MNFTIELTLSEEAQLSEAAKQTGLAPAALVKKLVKEHLHSVLATDENDLDTNPASCKSRMA